MHKYEPHERPRRKSKKIYFTKILLSKKIVQCILHIVNTRNHEHEQYYEHMLKQQAYQHQQQACLSFVEQHQQSKRVAGVDQKIVQEQ